MRLASITSLGNIIIAKIRIGASVTVTLWRRVVMVAVARAPEMAGVCQWMLPAGFLGFLSEARPDPHHSTTFKSWGSTCPPGVSSYVGISTCIPAGVLGLNIKHTHTHEHIHGVCRVFVYLSFSSLS